MSDGAPHDDRGTDCYTGDPELLPVAIANARIAERVWPVSGGESVALPAALGRVLERDVTSPFDVPNHTNSAVDGFAFDGAALPAEGDLGLRVVGTAWAGRPLAGAVGEGEAARIMTGAVMPEGADTVVMLEHAEGDGDTVRIGTGHRTGQNVRHAGEDLQTGAVVLAAGTRLMPAELGLLASLGIAEAPVRRLPRVAMFSTGDELLSLGDEPAPGMVFDSNRYTLSGMLARLGVPIVDLGVIRDDRDATFAAVERAASEADLVITSGGASAGAADHVSAALTRLGEVGFWRIAIRPGRPLAFGRVGDAAFFGLPGNPVAVMVTFYQFVQPALRRMMGETGDTTATTLRAVCTTPLRKKPGRVEYYRAVLEHDAAGTPSVRHTGKTGSGLLHTMSDANCFIVLPEDGESVERGAVVDVQPFFGLM